MSDSKIVLAIGPEEFKEALDTLENQLEFLEYGSPYECRDALEKLRGAMSEQDRKSLISSRNEL